MIASCLGLRLWIWTLLATVLRHQCGTECNTRCRTRDVKLQPIAGTRQVNYLCSESAHRGDSRQLSRSRSFNPVTTDRVLLLQGNHERCADTGDSGDIDVDRSRSIRAEVVFVERVTLRRAQTQRLARYLERPHLCHLSPPVQLLWR